ncbi:MAG: sodium:solute symporter family protein [Phycisphaerae bacterium]|nr:sodium:solute symporter family protein [Phycisphaerae bacterium]
MNLHWIDWVIVFGMLTFVVGVAISTKKHTQSVADFLAANRCAGRYLLCIAEGMSGLGAISVVAFFERFYAAGFTAAWWDMLLWPVGLVVALSGWVSYRYRETRAMTLAQFFEIRYSKRFRVYAGIVAWVSGVINMGIFPAVGARFFIYFCGLPETVPGLGISTFATLMVLLLAVSILFVFLGGQIAVMITDFIQGMFTNVAFLIILIVIFWMFDWSEMIATLKTAPENASRIHPFNASAVKGFNFWFFLIQAVATVYGWRAWQGSQGYFCSAKSAHEAKMAGILGAWRLMVQMLVLMLLPIGAWVMMHHPDKAYLADQVRHTLSTIGNEQIQEQMTVPVALVKMLPMGVAGMLCAVMLAAFISTHDTYLHSWGSIFVQDVILPFRKKPFTPKQHFWLLRASVVLVAVIIFFFSLLFRQNDFIMMFFALSGTIYLGGAGSVIIGGLYWKRGTTMGAWLALSVGVVLGLGGLFLNQGWRGTVYPWLVNRVPWLHDALKTVVEGISNNVPGIHWKIGPEGFPFDGQWIYAFAIVMAVGIYVTTSLLGSYVFKKPDFDMDRLLHRGRYARKGEHADNVEIPSGWRAVLPSKEFTFWDKIIYHANLIWTLLWILVFLTGTVYGLFFKTTDDGWAKFWRVYVIITVSVGAGTTIWYFFGGIHDIKDLYSRLRTLKRDYRDVGMVVHGHDLSEEPEAGAIPLVVDVPTAPPPDESPGAPV